MRHLFLMDSACSHIVDQYVNENGCRRNIDHELRVLRAKQMQTHLTVQVPEQIAGTAFPCFVDVDVQP